MAEDKAYFTFTDENFERAALQSAEPVLVDFWAPWCGPCRVIGPVIEELAQEFQGRVKVGKLNVDENQLASRQFGIRSIPTLLLVQGGRVVDQMIGAVPKAVLRDKLAALTRAAA